MYAVETLKKNVTDLFSTLAFVFDEDADDVIDFICDMDFPEIYQGIRKRALPIFRHATGVFNQDQPMYISEKLLPLEGTLICRDINRAYDIDENYQCRRYLELWVLEDMSLRFISNFTTMYNDGTHYTEYRQDQGSDFPNEEYWLDLEDVFEALISFWKQDANPCHQHQNFHAARNRRIYRRDAENHESGSCNRLSVCNFQFPQKERQIKNEETEISSYS